MAFSVQRFLVFLLLLALVGVSAYLTVELMRTQREYQAFRERHDRTVQQLAHLREEREKREAYLRAILNDPEFVERVVRERLGYVEPGEMLYRFEDRPETGR